MASNYSDSRMEPTYTNYRICRTTKPEEKLAADENCPFVAG